MKKEEVLKIKILKYKNKKECPEYSIGYDDKNKHCKYRFFCRNDYCSSQDQNGYIQLPNKEGKMESLNTNICFTYKCNDEKPLCSSNSDCFTNSCNNSTCIIKEGSPTTECMEYYYYNAWILSYKAKMHCGLGQGELCKKNKNCASRICEINDNSQNDVCSKENSSKDISKERLYDILVRASSFIILLTLFNIINCFKNRKSKEKNDIEDDESDIDISEFSINESNDNRNESVVNRNESNVNRNESNDNGNDSNEKRDISQTDITESKNDLNIHQI